MTPIPTTPGPNPVTRVQLPFTAPIIVETKSRNNNNIINNNSNYKNTIKTPAYNAPITVRNYYLCNLLTNT